MYAKLYDAITTFTHSASEINILNYQKNKQLLKPFSGEFLYPVEVQRYSQ